jgi:branched-chain amino acid transport system permease protein
MDYSLIGTLVLNGLVWGVIVAAMAVGLSMTFGLTRIINLAHAELFTWGGIVSWYVLAETKSFTLAVLTAFLATAIGGTLMYVGLLRFLRGNTVLGLLLTFGLAMVLQHAALMTFGSSARSVLPPPLLRESLSLGDREYPSYRLCVALGSAALLVGVCMLVHHTRFGVWMRAVQMNRALARTVGIPITTVFVVIFGLGSGLAGAMGALAAPIVAVEFRAGVELLPLVLMTVLLGGLNDMRGPVIAAITLALVENLLVAAVTPTLAKVLTLAAGGVLIVVFPEGIRQAMSTMRPSIGGAS